MALRNNFKKISESEKRANLLSVIIAKTDGKLAKGQLEIIVNSIDIYNKYKIKVLTDAKQFAEEIILKTTKEYGSYNNNPSLMGGLEETGKVILGSNLEFGSNFKEDWDSTEENTPCNFNIEEIYVVTKQVQYDFVPLVNPEQDNEHWENNEIIIYLPNEFPYKISPKVQYILNNFNIK